MGEYVLPVSVLIEWRGMARAKAQRHTDHMASRAEDGKHAGQERLMDLALTRISSFEIKSPGAKQLFLLVFATAVYSRRI